MKLSILLIVTLTLLLSCGAEEVKPKAQNEDPKKDLIPAYDSTNQSSDTAVIETIIADTVKEKPIAYSYLMSEEIELLGGYLSEDNIRSLDYSLVQLTEAESDTSVINHFLNLIRATDLFKDSAINEKGYLDPMEAEEKFAILPDAIMGFQNSCMAECTEYDCSINMEPFFKIAKKTSGTLDDEFFELIELMDGERYTSSHNFKNWFGQVWDYGGGTLLGDSSHFNFLSKSKILMSKTDLTNSFLSRYIDECGGDMLHGIYMYSTDQVLSEIELILQLEMLNQELTNSIEKLKTTILSGDYTWENCVGGQLQFNCETGGCDFGG